ncbi:hypothetical protein, partial [Raoultella ornithinolytica]|uniref:hypothetical protein n=1 Tax=Raoultella ornithinolytica TaxID=54291 RepID=UPI0013D9F802
GPVIGRLLPAGSLRRPARGGGVPDSGLGVSVLAQDVLDELFRGDVGAEVLAHVPPDGIEPTDVRGQPIAAAQQAQGAAGALLMHEV